MKYQISEFVEELDQIIENQLMYLKKEVVPLDKDHLEWRPGPYRWNILEVIEHLNRFSEFYLPRFSSVISRPDALRESDIYKSFWFSEIAFKRIRPVDGVVPFKTKSLSKNNPFLRILDRTVIEEHIDMQKRFRELIHLSAQLNLSKNKVPTMVGNWLKLNLGDSMRLHAYHTERHYVQMDNLVKRKDHDV